MNRARVAGIAGIVAVLLVVADAIVTGGVPRSTASTHKILSYYASDSHLHRQEAALILGALSMVFFLPFLGGLRSVVRSADRAHRWLAHVVLAAGTAFAVLFASLSTMRGTVAFALDTSDAFRAGHLDPQLVRALEVARSLFFIHALVAGAILIGAASWAMLRTRIFVPRIGSAGIALAVLVLIGAFLATSAVFLLLAWIVVVSLALLLVAPMEDALPARPVN